MNMKQLAKSVLAAGATHFSRVCIERGLARCTSADLSKHEDRRIVVNAILDELAEASEAAMELPATLSQMGDSDAFAEAFDGAAILDDQEDGDT